MISIFYWILKIIYLAKLCFPVLSVYLFEKIVFSLAHVLISRDQDSLFSLCKQINQLRLFNLTNSDRASFLHFLPFSPSPPSFSNSSMAVSKLEPELRDSIRSQYGDSIQRVYFNKGLWGPLVCHRLDTRDWIDSVCVYVICLSHDETLCDFIILKLVLTCGNLMVFDQSCLFFFFFFFNQIMLLLL